MAISLYYVDPSIAGNSGSGTVGDPYGDLQYALDSITRNSTDGDQINIKAGTDEVLAAALSLATYGTPAVSAPLVLRGYTSAANDGGIGGIDGNGSYTMISPNTLDYIVFRDLHLHNSGAADVIDLDDWVYVINCEVDNTTGKGIDLGTACRIIGCYIHNCAGYGVETATAGYIAFNYFANGTNDFTRCINMASQGVVAEYNICDIDGSTMGIVGANNNYLIRNNTIYANAGTGDGIWAFSTEGHVINNYVEGFSGAGGVGYLMSGDIIHYISNRWYNCTTGESVTGTVIFDEDNSAVSASALKAPGSDDFRADGQLRAASWPSQITGIDEALYIDLGALQRKEPLRIARARVIQ